MKEDECMFTVALCDKDEKVAVASVPMKEIKGKSRDKYYPMTSKKKGANPEIRLRFSVGAPLKAARMRKSESRSRMRDSGEEDSGSDRDSMYPFNYSLIDAYSDALHRPQIKAQKFFASFNARIR
jgi:hypothetical protein